MNKRVLLADDDEDDRLIFETVFSELGQREFTLSTVENGQEVLSFLKQSSDALPYLIILDQNMPLMSGKDTLVALKASPQYQQIPVIIYSTYNDQGFIDACKELGVANVVTKPNSYEGFTQMVEDFLKV